MATPIKKDGKPAKADTTPAEHELTGVWSDIENQGFKIVIQNKEGGNGAPGPAIYTVESISKNWPRVFCLTESALKNNYRPRPDIRAEELGLTTKNVPL